MSAPALHARDLVRRFAETAVVRSVTLALQPGEAVALLGPSGCGKTTLLQMLGLLDPPTAGRVLYGDADAWAMDASARAHLRLRCLGLVLQQGNLLGHLSARDNVALPHWRRGGSRRAAVRAADELLERLDLAARRDAPARLLSGGEAQRVAIARALVNRPRVVLADEPTGSLDSAAAGRVLDALTAARDRQTALLLVTHAPEVATWADRTLRMRDGALV